MDASIPKIRIYIPGYCPDELGYSNSISKIDILGGLYIFIFHEDINKPVIHLINKNYNIALYIDEPVSNYNFSKEEKEYINNWMHDVTGNEHYGENKTNWHVLKFLWGYINSKFEEDYFEETGEDYDWSKIFPNEIPDYNLL
jgi:hypothetical protein